VKSRPWLLSCAFVLSVQSLASADEPVAEWVKHRVETGLLKPLAQQESNRSKFSRERPPPAERRVRVLETNAATDKSGRPFVPFAIDVRYLRGDWTESITGCAYRQSGNLFVKAGSEYRPASYLLGKRTAVVAGACEAAPPPATS
jgi:hypothetical protein